MYHHDRRVTFRFDQSRTRCSKYETGHVRDTFRKVNDALSTSRLRVLSARVSDGKTSERERAD